MTRARLLAMMGAAGAASLALTSLARAAGGEGGEGGEHPATWLNGLYHLRISGHPVVTNPAQLAFAWALLLVLALILAALWGSRQISLRPGRFQALLEMGLNALQSVVEGTLGPHGAGFLPFIGTIFLYVLLMNLMGLIPGFIAPTSNFSITAGMAVMIFLVVQFYGLKERGLGYAKHFLEGLPPGVVFLPLAPLILVIHVVGEFVRPVSLAIRLFGNISGEETVVAALVGLMASTRYFFWVPVQLPNLALGLLTAFVQALIMALLAAVYLAGVMHHEEHGAALPHDAVAGG